MPKHNRNLKGLNVAELQEFVESLGEKKYRAQQVFTWLYGKRAQTFDEMTDISKEFRALLHNTATIENLQIAAKDVSKRDGTVKFLFQLTDGLKIESVLIPPDKKSPAAEKRLTLCVSTQVGCPLDCKFCATGTMGFLRNLTAGEIVDQVIQAQRNSPRRITNLVFMGMGEPMLNYDNVMKSVEILRSEDSFHIGARHITISTAGYADKIRQMADEGRTVKLALSLHSLDNDKRTQLMPITKKYSVDELMDALDYYYKKTRSRPTFEYILFDGFNDADADAQKFIKISKRFPCKVNIIPFHSIEFTHPSGFATTLRPTPAKRVEEFVEKLRRSDITVMVRSSSGEDINAACGQLAVQEERSTRLRTPHGPAKSLHTVHHVIS
ncbi:MAG TPA: 23S rRNA (adenine(2503)-C(2))-methyltransferase RlmN [Bacteroidota bacterium]